MFWVAVESIIVLIDAVFWSNAVRSTKPSSIDYFAFKIIFLLKTSVGISQTEGVELFLKKKYANSESLVQVAQRNSLLHCPNYTMATTESIWRGLRVKLPLLCWLVNLPWKGVPKFAGMHQTANSSIESVSKGKGRCTGHSLMPLDNKGKRGTLIIYGYLRCRKSDKPSLSIERVSPLPWICALQNYCMHPK